MSHMSTRNTALIPVVVTDLDGTLLDHHTYSWDAAGPALLVLHEYGIPVVLNSSKTAAEMRAFRIQLGNQHPFVVENGGGICVPDADDRFIPLGGARSAILDIIHTLREEKGFRFTGFADMSVPELISHTGLDPDCAVAALDRQFTEPLLWQDDEQRIQDFAACLESAGLRFVKGGRFWHVSTHSDKGRAIPWLRAWYGETTGLQPHVIALGDGDNDISMMEAADTAVIIPSPVNPLPHVHNPNCIIANQQGPAGWNEAMLSILKKLGYTRFPEARHDRENDYG